jgi:hypothetical protein
MGENWWAKRAQLLQHFNGSKDNSERDSKMVLQKKKMDQKLAAKYAFNEYMYHYMCMPRKKMGCLKYYFCPVRQ